MPRHNAVGFYVSVEPPTLCCIGIELLPTFVTINNQQSIINNRLCAVVVEEACEVMEPTLISVLAVKSLWKLSLIGDHRQLSAFVQNCWYNLQTTHPCRKKSLFERLIDSEPSKHDNVATASAVPHTVLDEQRRMRQEIADITR
jgi:superfamily I DNA and/or RNA helicase